MKNKEFWGGSWPLSIDVSVINISTKTRMRWGRSPVGMWGKSGPARNTSGPSPKGACLMFCRRDREVSSPKVEWGLWLLLRWCLFGGRKTRRENLTKPNRIQSFKRLSPMPKLARLSRWKMMEERHPHSVKMKAARFHWPELSHVVLKEWC